MENENTVMTDIKVNETGKVSFAPDVIATIEGVTGLGGGFADSLTGILGGKKSYTKGVRVEVGQEEAAVDVVINVKYGSKIQLVCAEVQQEVKKAIEMMTGLRVVEVNVCVQSVTFENDKDEKKKPEEPRVK